MRKFLIDGYNLFFQVPELAGSDCSGLEDRRERLIRRLIGLSADRKIKIHLVFDSSRSPHGRTDYSGVQVDYASPTADAFIRRLISRNEGNRDLVVVSSDRKDIGEFARTCGLEWMTSQQFWAWVTKNNRRRSGDASDCVDGGNAPPGWTSQDDTELKRLFEKNKPNGEEQDLMS